MEENVRSASHELYEPNKCYKTVLAEKHATNTKEYWEELVRKSGVNPEENRALVNEYNKAAEDAKETADNVRKLRKIRTLDVVGMILLAVVGIIMILATASNIGSNVLAFIIGILLILGGIGLLVLLILKINPLIKDRDQLQQELDEKAAAAKQVCYQNMEPLNNLFDEDQTRQIIQKTLPDITIDPYMDVRRLDLLNRNYGKWDNSDLNTSVLEVTSGDMHGNPYVIQKELLHNTVMQDYTGELTIHWDEVSYGSDGSRTTVHKSQTLRATIQKPKEVYGTASYLIFGSEMAPNLSFTKEARYLHQLNDKQLQKQIKADSKEITKLADQAIKKGGTFTAMNNTDFDAMFHALDRDNETEFRFLFSPLAQNNMIDLMRNSEFGDDFDFRKSRMLNMISAKHTEDWDMNTASNQFVNYDLEAAKNHFFEFNAKYFKHFFYLFAPILSIPVYQDYKTKEFIYQNTYSYSYSGFETEALANQIGETKFAHPASNTISILKTHAIATGNSTDRVQVDAYSYKTEDRVEYVSVYGDDGYYHDVPVPWVEYVPLYQSSIMTVSNLNASESEFRAAEKQSGSRDFFAQRMGNYAYKHRLFACIGEDASLARSLFGK